MTQQVRTQKSVNITGGGSFTEAQTQKGSASVQQEINVAKALAGTLTTRTDNTTGTLTIPSNTIITGARISIYWAGGRQKGVTVGTVSGNSVPFSGGTGTNLPSTTTPVQACVEVQASFNVVGNNMLAIAFETDVFGMFDVQTSAPADALAAAIFPQGASYVDANVAYTWVKPVTAGAGTPNPLAGVTAANIWVSHNDTVKAHTMRASALVA